MKTVHLFLLSDEVLENVIGDDSLADSKETMVMDTLENIDTEKGFDVLISSVMESVHFEDWLAEYIKPDLQAAREEGAYYAKHPAEYYEDTRGRRWRRG